MGLDPQTSPQWLLRGQPAGEGERKNNKKLNAIRSFETYRFSRGFEAVVPFWGTAFVGAASGSVSFKKLSRIAI